MTTKQFNQQVHCPNCHTWITHETSFGRWIRNNPNLDSEIGYVVTDQDYWIHQYKRYDNREFQCLMLVEIKTFGSELSTSQRSTFHWINLLMRNRRQRNLHLQAGSGPIICGKSTMTGKNILLRSFGMHVLRFSHLGPDDSEWIKWNDKNITIDTLTSILRFDLDPDTLLKIDFKQHHKTRETIYLEKMPLGFVAPHKLITRS